MQTPILVLGASGKIGSEISKNLYEMGHSLVLHGNRNKPHLKANLNKNQIVDSVNADLTDEKAVEKLFEYISDTYGSLSGVVISVAKPFDNKLCYRTEWKVFDEQLTSQLKLCHFCLRAAYPLLKVFGKSCTARVLIISTEYTLGTPPMKIAPYVVAKSALNTYAMVIAQEWLKNNIRVHIIAPGMVESNLTNHLPMMYIEEMKKSLPEQKLTQVEDVASVAKFLMTCEGDALYGKIIPVTRGHRKTS